MRAELASLKTIQIVLYPAMTQEARRRRETAREVCARSACGDAIDHQTTGFGAFYETPNPPGGHTHDAIELSVFEGGGVTMLYGGRPVTVGPDRLVAHWGMVPHQMLSREPGARVIGVHVPLSWVLEWPLPGGLLSRLLDLEVLIEPARTAPCGDLALLREWHRLLTGGGPDATAIVLLELRARLLRLARSADSAHAAVAPGRPPAPTAFSLALRFIGRNYREPLRHAAIARAAGLSARHLTRVFAEYTGQTVTGYITHLRLSHARRLLATTDRKILDVMHDAGFSCTTQFYRLFREQTGISPRRYRALGGAERPV